jgi:hypothetical protein
LPSKRKRQHFPALSSSRSLISWSVNGGVEIEVAHGVDWVFECEVFVFEFDVLISQFVPLFSPSVDFYSESFFVEFPFLGESLFEHVNFEFEGFVGAFE